jgi:hypothetical protein
MLSTGNRNLFSNLESSASLLADNAGFCRTFLRPRSKDAKGSDDKAAATDPLKRTIPEKQKKQNSKSLKIELSKTYKKWLDEDVRWIITDEEQKAFKLLSNDEERDQFIEAFWQRRDPTPDTIENEFKEEHYRRMAYANEHYRRRHPRLEERSRPNLYYVRTGG